MAFERAAPPALRWVALFLALCAALGLWLGFKDQMRRNPPAWYTGGTEKVAAGEAGAPAREAVAFDPNARAAPLPETAAATPEKKSDEDKSDDEAPEAAATTPEAKPAEAAAVPAPKLKTAPPPVIKPAPSEDPVGDILDGQKPADTPPPVPY